MVITPFPQMFRNIWRNWTKLMKNFHWKKQSFQCKINYIKIKSKHETVAYWISISFLCQKCLVSGLYLAILFTSLHMSLPFFIIKDHFPSAVQHQYSVSAIISCMTPDQQRIYWTMQDQLLSCAELLKFIFLWQKALGTSHHSIM